MAKSKSENDASARAADITAAAALIATKLVAEAAETAKILAASAAATATTLMPQVATVAADLSKHEAICVERYVGLEKGQASIEAGLETIRKGIYKATGSILGLLILAIGYFLVKNGLPGH